MGCLAPEPEDPASPPASHQTARSLREQYSATRWRPETLNTTPPLTPQVHLPGRCAPDNQRHGPSPDPAQNTRCHQVVGPQRMQILSAAWKVGSSFLCTLCFIFIDSFLLIALFNFYVCTLYISYFYFHVTLIVFHILGFRIF